MSKTLVPFLPGPRLVETDGKLDWVDNSVDAGGQSIGRMHPFWGQFGVVLRAWAYMKTLGPDLKRASELAVLNANYIKFSLKDLYDLPFPQPSLHECVFTDKKQEEFGVSTMDIAKRLIDCGIHPPTIYFPLVVHGAIMIEPTESENLEDLDAFIEAAKNALPPSSGLRATPDGSLSGIPSPFFAVFSALWDFHNGTAPL